MLRPRNDYIVVKRDAPEKVSTGGIELVLAIDAAQAPMQGQVLAVGPGTMKKGKLVPLAVKAGDRVLFEAYAGNTVQVQGEELVMMKEDEIFAVLEKTTT